MQYKKSEMVKKGNEINSSSSQIQINDNKKKNIIVIILVS